MSSDQNGSRPRRGEKEEDLKPNGEERPGREEADKSKNHGKKYDLEERTARFGESIIDFVKTLPNNVINRELIGQMVRAGTSVGANYNEADGAESKKDFRHKIAICKKESKESKHWLRMIARANPDRADECRPLWGEAQELTLIFSSILSPKKSR
jgi:four helix bundle protein